MFWPSSSLACCLQSASDSSHSSYLPFLNRSTTYFSKFNDMGNYSKSVGNHTFFDPDFSRFILQKSFRTGTSTRLDDRVFSMCQLKYQPLAYSMLMIHPSLYRVDDLTDEVREQKTVLRMNHIFLFSFWPVFESRLFCFVNCQGALNINERTIPQPRLLQLSVEKLSREGAFLMDAGTVWCLLVLLSSKRVHVCIYGWHRPCFLF